MIQEDNDILGGMHNVFAGLPPQSHQGLHVPDNKKRFESGSCPGAENGIPAATDVWRAASSTRRKSGYV